MNVDLSGWLLLESEEQLRVHYPKHIWGTYRPQPFYEPDSYPCWFKEIVVMNNDNGPDHAMLAFIYPAEE